MDFDRRYIFLLVAAVLVFFLYVPFSLEMPADPDVKSYFEAIESLKPGDIVVVATEYSPATEAEQWNMHENTLFHLFARDVKVINISTWETGPDIMRKYVEKGKRLVKEQLGKTKERDVDYTELAYTTGREIVMVTAASSIAEAFPKTREGRTTSEIPIMKGVAGLAPDPVTGERKIKFLIDFASGNPGTREWIRMVAKRYDVPILAGVTSVMAPDLYPFIRSGQVKGLLAGLPGGQQYEQLLRKAGIRKEPSEIDKDMAIQSAIHFLIIALVVLGNISFFLTRRRGEA